MQRKLIGDKMLETSVEELGCKCPISSSWVIEGMFLKWIVMVTSPEMIENSTFIHLKMATQPAKTANKEDE
jgi:hypothetical protein